MRDGAETHRDRSSQRGADSPGPNTLRVVGLMSGTSLDGIDAALVEFEGRDPGTLRWRLVAGTTVSYSHEQREQIHDVIVNGGAGALCRLHADLGEWFAAAVLEVCDAAGVEPDEVDLVGTHGQTVWHDPPDEDCRGATLQLGCRATIAERTGIAVVGDFRARDVAAGGEGAPLVPWVDRLLFSLPDRRRVLQNIGGMANLTWLPPRASNAPILAFDTGPGNALIDAAVELATRGAERYDTDGRWATRGVVLPELLDELISHPYFHRDPPKSTGREVFGRPFVEEIVRDVQPEGEQEWSDLIATLTTLTAESIANALSRWVLPRGVDEYVVTGGGARNPVLVRLLEDRIAPLPVTTAEALGVDPDMKEAVAFAALAWAHVHGVPANVPSATGAIGPRVLGNYTPGSEAAPTSVAPNGPGE